MRPFPRRPSPQVIARLEQRLRALLRHAEQHYGCRFPTPELNFDLVGTTAGRAYPKCFRIAVNTVLLEENLEEYLRDTLAHELAHLLTLRIHGPQVRPHGQEWRAVMRLFGVTPKRTHSYDVTTAQIRRLRRYTYRCTCRTYELTSVRHRRAAEGRSTYRCRHCGAELVPA